MGTDKQRLSRNWDCHAQLLQLLSSFRTHVGNKLFLLFIEKKAFGLEASCNLPAAALPNGRQSTGTIRSEELSLKQFPLLKGPWRPTFHKNACKLGLSSNHWFLYQFSSDTCSWRFLGTLSFPYAWKQPTVESNILAWELCPDMVIPGQSLDGMVLMLIIYF